MTVTEVCDWYLKEAEAGRILGRRNRPIKSSTLVMDKSRIENHIKPLLGRRQVRALKTPDIAAMQSDIAVGKTAKRRGTRPGGAIKGGDGTAARTVSTLQSLFGHAVRMGLIESNPAEGVRKIAGKKRERRLSRAEIGKIGEALRLAEQHGENPFGLSAVRLLLLTGYRISEVVGMEWSWLNAEAGYVRFPDTKSGGQVRAIGNVAADYASTLPVQSGSALIFPSGSGSGSFTTTPNTLARCVH